MITCPISLQETADFKTLRCGHQFDREEIMTWLFINSACPLCRRPASLSDIASRFSVVRFKISHCRRKSFFLMAACQTALLAQAFTGQNGPACCILVFKNTLGMLFSYLEKYLREDYDQIPESRLQRLGMNTLNLGFVSLCTGTLLATSRALAGNEEFNLPALFLSDGGSLVLYTSVYLLQLAHMGATYGNLALLALFSTLHLLILLPFIIVGHP